MLECLQHAQAAYLKASSEQKQLAYRHFLNVLGQFNALVLKGTIPPEDPCYTGQGI